MEQAIYVRKELDLIEFVKYVMLGSERKVLQDFRGSFKLSTTLTVSPTLQRVLLCFSANICSFFWCRFSFCSLRLAMYSLKCLISENFIPGERPLSLARVPLTVQLVLSDAHSPRVVLFSRGVAGNYES